MYPWFIRLKRRRMGFPENSSLQLKTIRDMEIQVTYDFSWNYVDLLQT